MKSDIKGLSQCMTGYEQYEEFYNYILKKRMVQYDYRTNDGELFTIIKSTLQDCRTARDKWLENKTQKSGGNDIAEFIINIKEVLEREITVTASNKKEALKNVRLLYNNEQIVLDSADFKEVKFEVVYRR